MRPNPTPRRLLPHRLVEESLFFELYKVNQKIGRLTGKYKYTKGSAKTKTTAETPKLPKTELPKHPKYVIPPKGCMSHLRPNKKYEVKQVYGYYKTTGYKFSIIDKDGDEILCTEKQCVHLKLDNWIVIR